MLREVPLYIITGFLESGKTTFLQDVVTDSDFTGGKKSLLILCEEGEVEYDEKELAGLNVDIITVDEESDFTPEFLMDCVKHYQPRQIFIEMNGMWNVKWLYESKLPGKLVIAQVITLVDGSTFGVYLNNMRGILSNLFQYTEMVIFNRCTPEMDLNAWRRAVKGVNQGAMIYFEDEVGNQIDPGMEEPPYDLNADVIQIEDVDYGLWYLDTNDNPDRYDGKTVRFRAKVMKSKHFGDGVFVPGRNVMTCCADDIRFMGYLCKAEFESLLKARQWIWVTAEIHYEYAKEYGQKGPVLYGKSYELTGAPEVDTVYFN